MTSDQPGVYRPQLSVDRDFTIIPNAWIRNSALSPSANYLLIYLMTHEVGYEITFGQMQRETGLGIKGVRSALAELQDKGWLVMERTKRSNGQLGAYRYTLIESTVPQSTVVASTVAQGTDNKKNKVEEEQSKETNTPKGQLEELFLEFWNAYPKKVDKAKAFKSFRSALTRAKFEDILAGVIAYRNDPKRNPDYTKYPATWLNSDSWENAAAKPDTAISERRERELERSKAYLAEIEAVAAQAAPPPKCEHGNTIVTCKICFNKLG